MRRRILLQDSGERRPRGRSPRTHYIATSQEEGGSNPALPSSVHIASANQQILIVPKAATARCFRAVGIEVKALSGSHTESISGAFADGALIVLPNDLAICARRIAVIRRLGERWRHDASRRTAAM
jgi:hypothetical protein